MVVLVHSYYIVWFIILFIKCMMGNNIIYCLSWLWSLWRIGLWMLIGINKLLGLGIVPLLKGIEGLILLVYLVHLISRILVSRLIRLWMFFMRGRIGICLSDKSISSQDSLLSKNLLILTLNSSFIMLINNSTNV